MAQEKRDKRVLHQIRELIRSGFLLGAVKLVLAVPGHGRLSQEAEALFRELCRKLEATAKIAFDAGDRRELRSILDLSGLLADRRIPTAERVHSSIMQLLARLTNVERHSPGESYSPSTSAASAPAQPRPASSPKKKKAGPGTKAKKTGPATRAKPKAESRAKAVRRRAKGKADPKGKTQTKKRIKLKGKTPPKTSQLGEIMVGGGVELDAHIPLRPPELRDELLLSVPMHDVEERDLLPSENSGPEEFPVAVRDAVVERIPHIDLNIEEPLPPGRMFRVWVYADQSPARPGEDAEPMVFHIPSEITSFSVEVELLFTTHFVWVPEALKNRKNQLTIHRDQATSEKLEFILMVCDKDKLESTQPAITAIFHHDRRPSGKVTRKLSIEGLKVEPPGPPKDERRGPTPPPGGPIATISVTHDAVPPDLVISVFEREEKDGRNFDVIVDSGTLPKRWWGKWTLGMRTDEIVKNAMTTFQTANRPAVKLKSAGIAMFKAAPKEFQEMFWEMVDQRKLPRHILIISEEPYIPWELMVPQRRLPTGKFETRDALGVEFCVGRWITDKYVSPPQKIGFPRVSVVAPDYPIGRQLKHSAAEVATIQQCFQSVEKISPALVKTIDDFLAQKGAALLHFVCHGSAGIPQSISLEQDQEKLSCWDVRALDGFLSSFEKAKTFVFLNACEVGRAAPALVGIDGFGNTFASIGASGVIAPLWSVDDNIAHQVAEYFYNRVIARPTIPFAEILRDIRAKAYAQNGEDTWAAYCFYGDPMSTLV